MKAPVLWSALALAILAPAAAAAQVPPLAIEPAGRQGAYDVYLARDQAGREITVLTQGPLSDAHRQALLDLRDRALGLQALRVRSARALVSADAIEVLVVPDAYVVEGQDLTPFLPGGIRFHLDGALSYDFRMLVGHYFLRIAGSFESEEALGRRLLEAVKTPAAFLKADTMAYVSDRFSALDARVGEIERRGGEALRDLDALKEQQTSLRAEQAAAKNELEAVKASMVDLSSRRVDSDVEALQKSLGALSADAEAMRSAVVVLQSRNGNFNKRGVDREAVTRLVELKRANPGLTQAEAAAQLKAQGTPMSSKDVALVFGVFFQEYR